MPHLNGTIAVLIVITLAHQAHAQPLDEMELPRLAATERTPHRDPLVDEPFDYSSPEEEAQPRGSVYAEILGGTIGLALGSAITYAVMVQPVPECNSGHVPVPCLNSVEGRVFAMIGGVVPFMTASGVYIGGVTSGGSTRFMPAWGGAMLGLVAGFLVSAPFAGEGATPNELLGALPVMAVTATAGSVLLYRVNERRAEASIASTADGRGAMLTIHGAL